MKPYLFLAIGLLASQAKGAVSLLLTDAIGAPNSVTIQPGDSFSVSLRLNSTAETTSGLTYFFEASGSGSGFFEITGRDLTGSAFGDVTTQNNILFSPTILLDPVNDNDLGGLADSVNPAGDYFVASFTFDTLAGIAPGTYTIGINGAIITDENFDEISGVSLPTYTVTVVPEPASAALLGLGFAGLMMRRRK